MVNQKKINHREEYTERCFDICKEIDVEFITGKFINNTTKMEFRCKEGHLYKRPYATMRNGCPDCSRNLTYLKQIQKIESFKPLTCLDKDDLHWQTKSRFHIFQCNICQETFKISLLNIKLHEDGGYCRKCNYNKRMGTY